MVKHTTIKMKKMSHDPAKRGQKRLCAHLVQGAQGMASPVTLLGWRLNRSYRMGSVLCSCRSVQAFSFSKRKKQISFE